MRLSIWIVCLAMCVGAIFTFNLFSPHEETNSNRYKSLEGQAVELALISPGKPPAKDHSDLNKGIHSDFSIWDHKSLKGLSDILLTARDPDYWLDAENLSMNGFEITDRLDRLGTMRIRVHDPDDFARFLRDNADDFELQKNLRLKTVILQLKILIKKQKITVISRIYSVHLMQIIRIIKSMVSEITEAVEEARLERLLCESPPVV